MPRLDWQMWFAALGTWRENPWYLAFVHGLLTGSAPVQSLLAENPFGAAPPLQIRSTIWRYRFATDGERAQGRWWTRELAGAYCPVLELDEQGELRTAP
jgi:hypothetical protein